MNIGLRARGWLALERFASGIRRRDVNVDSLSVPYLEAGTGPVLVLLHGFGADGYHFARVAKHLRGRFRVLCPDLPGFGSASRDRRLRHDIPSQAAHVVRFLDALGIQRAHIGGNSMGGFVAAQIAIDQPDRVSSLWLLNALGCPTALQSEMFATYTREGHLPLLVRSKADFDRLVSMVTAKAVLMPRSLREAYAKRAIADLPLHTDILDELTQHSPPLTAQKAIAELPVCIVWGARDRILSPACVVEQQTVFPNHQIVMMPDVGHLPMIESPAQTARDYLRFFDAKVAGSEGSLSASSKSTNR